MTLCNVPEGRTPHLHHGGSLKSREFRIISNKYCPFPLIWCISSRSMMWSSSQEDSNALPNQHQVKESPYIRASSAPPPLIMRNIFAHASIRVKYCVWNSILWQPYWLFFRNWTRAEPSHSLFRKTARSVKQKVSFTAALGINLTVIPSRQPVERSEMECSFQ